MNSIVTFLYPDSVVEYSQEWDLVKGGCYMPVRLAAKQNLFLDFDIVYEL